MRNPKYLSRKKCPTADNVVLFNLLSDSAVETPENVIGNQRDDSDEEFEEAIEEDSEDQELVANQNLRRPWK